MVSEKQHAIRRELEDGACVPRLSTLARNLGMPSSTIRYNIERLEEDDAIHGYTAVTDSAAFDFGFEGYVLLSFDDAVETEALASTLGRREAVRSLDVVTGEYDAIMRVREDSREAFFSLSQHVTQRTPCQPGNDDVMLGFGEASRPHRVEGIRG